MPHYFFDIHDGNELRRDVEGIHLDCQAQIRKVAMQTLPAIARDEIVKNSGRQCFMAIVRDEDNLVIYTATLSFADLWTGNDPLPQSREEHSFKTHSDRLTRCR